MESSHVTVLEIDLIAVTNNRNYFKSTLYENTKFLAVVKAFGYGTNAVAVARALAPSVTYFGVAYTDEGIALRKAGIENPILVLHPQTVNLKLLDKYNLEPNIYSIELLESFVTSLKTSEKRPYPIHIKINTGLNRLGFGSAHFSQLIALLSNQNNVYVKSVFSHIAASEDLDEKAFTMKQILSFKRAADQLSAELKIKPMKHMLNTSVVLNYAQQAQFDMVRIGIGLLGFGNEKEETQKLSNVLRLTSVISQIHTIEIGETVGYNRAFKAAVPIKTATIPVGHADGISRKLGNGVGFVYINDCKAPIVGNVCMDMIMVNVTDITCKEGDEVEVYKNQKHVEQLADAIETIPYELLAAISQRIKRITNWYS